MKRIINFVVIIISIICLFTLVGCGNSNSIQGEKGDTGNGIERIEKTNSKDGVDTYTIYFTNGEKTTFVIENGKDGHTPEITVGTNGNWYVDGVDTGVKAQGDTGEDGHTPEITVGTNGNWHVDGVDTGVKAQGDAGEDGHTPKITVGTNGNWHVDGVDTGVKAQGDAGEDGHTPEITVGTNGNWYVDGVDTGVKAQGDTGEAGKDGEDGTSGLSAYEIYCKHNPVYKGTEAEWIDAVCNGSLAKSYNTTYNIIFTLATIPPVLSALDSIYNEYPTYALIERGKTYNGIDKIDNFYNVGFNVSSNNSSGLSNDQFNAMVKQIEELNVYGNEKFNIYVQDGTALLGLGLAANARLNSDQYEIIMCEDGTGAYYALDYGYIAGRAVNSTVDEIYSNYVTQVEGAKSKVEQILSTTENKSYDSVFTYNIPLAYALASLDNFTYWLQDEIQVENIIDKSGTAGITKLYSCFGIDGYSDTVEYKLNLMYGSINDHINKLTEKQKEDYLTLMYGIYYEDTYETLMRSYLSDGITMVPSSKLVYIGTRVKGYPQIASNSSYGIGGATAVLDVPNNYADLNEKYKNSLLFPTENDYLVFINAINDMNNYDTTPTQEQLDAIRVQCFNYYIDYILNIKMTYAMYGENYDIIMKGHPSEVIGAYQNWTNHYVAGEYIYDKLMNNILLDFHESDTVGKYIGMVPYGTAAENLAYLGADVSIAGLDSSTYSGYDPSVDVLFVLQLTNGNITSNQNLNARYEAGNLTYVDLDGEEKTAKFINTGHVYILLNEIFRKNNETEMASLYENKFVDWLKQTYSLTDVSNYYLDEQGFLIEK